LDIRSNFSKGRRRSGNCVLSHQPTSTEGALVSNGLRSRLPAPAHALRRLGLPALATGLVGLAAALPSSAAADVQPRVEAATPAASAQVNVTALTPQAVQQLLAQIPAGGSGIPAVDLEVPQLAKVLVELPGIDVLPSVSGPGGTAAVETALREALEKLLAGGELPLGELLSSQTLLGELLPALETATGLPIGERIETLLHTTPQALLGEGLGSLDLSELLAKLLGSSANPTQLIDQLLEGLNPATLESLLGSLPAGSPLQNLDLGELAGELGKTPQQLAETLGQTLATLPETAQAATQALSGGNELALIKGLEGLSFGLVEKSTEGAGSLGSSGNSSTGSDGGSGGTPGSTTILLTTPGSATASPTAASATASAAAGKVKIVSHKVKGNKATLVVQVPAAGKLTLSGSGFRKVTREAAKAERLTVQTTLTKARAASLRKHHSRKTHVKLTSTFVPVSGHSSSASTSVSVR
jgi:hypothetical protein